MTNQQQTVDISPLRLDLKAGRLWNGESPIELRPKPWRLVRYMAEKPGELLTKQELIDAVWPDSFVSESSLNQVVKELRKALGDDARSPRFIETVHRRGFRLLTLEDRLTAAANEVPARPATLLCGRSSELGTLEHALAEAAAGRTQLVFLTGEAGIGKTSLIRRFLDELRPDSASVVGWGNCYDLRGESEAYLPFLESIDRMARGPNGEEVQRLLARIAPSWHAQFPWMLASGHEVDPGLLAISPTRMLREFCDFVDRLSAKALVAIWLEDLHWSDAGTIDLLDALAVRSANTRLLLIASYRPVDAAVNDAPVAAMKRSLVTRGLAKELSLEFLELTDVQQLIAHRLETAEFPKVLPQLLQEQTSGNPLFVVTALDHLLSEGLLVRRQGNWTFAAPIDAIRQRCPESLKDIVGLQRAAVSDEEADALDAASAVGTPVDTQAVAGALGADQLQIESLLDQLAERGQFVRRAGTANWPDGSVCQQFEFIHDVYREVTYQSLTPGRRRQLHHRIADCMEAGFAGAKDTVAAELALHTELGGDLQRSVRYLLQAAQKTESLRSPADTFAYLERALKQNSGLPDASERDHQETNILLLLVPALIGANGFTSARLPDYVDRAIALCEQQENIEGLLKMMNTRISLIAMPGNWNRLQPHVDELQSVCESVDNANLRAHAGSISARLELVAGNVEGARSRLESLLDSLEKEGLRDGASLYGFDPIVGVLSMLAFAEWLLGLVDRAKNTARRCQLRSEAVGAPQSLATGLHAAMTTALFRGEVEHARELEDRLQACLERNEFDYLYMRPLAARTRLLTAQGQPDNAIRIAVDGIDRARANQAIAFSSVALTSLAEAHLAAGNVEEGLQAADEALSHADATGERVWRPETLRIKGLLSSAAGDTKTAESCLRQAVQDAAGHSLLSFELRATKDLATLLIDLDRDDEARDCLENVLRRIEEGFDTVDYLDAQSLLSTGSALPAR